MLGTRYITPSCICGFANLIPWRGNGKKGVFRCSRWLSFPNVKVVRVAQGMLFSYMSTYLSAFKTGGWLDIGGKGVIKGTYVGWGMKGAVGATGGRKENHLNVASCARNL